MIQEVQLVHLAQAEHLLARQGKVNCLCLSVILALVLKQVTSVPYSMEEILNAGDGIIMVSLDMEILLTGGYPLLQQLT